jgi:glyoxylase-like metal-dependent hydrolase (beta-lactamase superfamily II)
MMTIHQIVNSVFNSCSYVLTQDKRSWLVDCGDVDQILPLIDGKLQGVLLTHAHFDHIYGLNNLESLFPGVPVYTVMAGLNGLMSDKLNFSRYYGEPFIFDSPDNIKLVKDGECISLFDGVEIKAVATPGHSPGCVTWLTSDAIFTGDSYIPGVKTVTNLPHSDKDLALKNEALIRQMIENRSIYPGHAASNEI